MPHSLVAASNLAPHPEGGWFRETLCRPNPDGGRDLVTAFVYLLEAGDRSRWHRVDATEMQVWNDDHPLTVPVKESGLVVEHFSSLAIRK